MVAPGLPLVAIHALLNYGPLAIISDKETVVRSKPSWMAALSTLATKRLVRVNACASKPTRSPISVSS